MIVHPDREPVHIRAGDAAHADATAAFAAAVDAREAGRRDDARRHLRELRRFGWSCCAIEPRTASAKGGRR